MKIPSTSDGMKTGYLLLTLIMVMLILLVATQRIFSHDYNRVNKNWPTPKEIQSGISSPNPNLGTTTSTGQGGYVLTHTYWEQITAASRNMITLQCWAHKHNMSVVEPSVKKSYLISPTKDEEVKWLLKFSDVYDLDHWNGMSHKASYSPLVQWEKFLQRAPRNLITVNFKYGLYGKSAGKKGNVDEKLYRQGCPNSASWKQLVKFLESKKFTVVREICINFSYNKEFSEPEFYEEVFGRYKPRDSTVLFGVWRGLLNNRMHVTGSGCDKPKANEDALLSKRVLLDAKKYKEKYLKMHNYIAIFLRMEKALESKQGVAYCFHETLDRWREMVFDSGINTTFLSADIGRLGSDSFRMAKHGLKGELELFNAIYGKALTIKQWEATFEDVTSSLQEGYIAMLQKAIASQAKCVLFVGGGSFQINALKLYKTEHAQKDWCLYLAKNCSHVLMSKHISEVSSIVPLS